jgi:spore maturation protein CgeB
MVLKGDRIAPATIEELRCRTGAIWTNFYPDDPFADVRSNRLAFGPATLRAYHHCFTFAQHLMAAYRSEGMTHVDWLPFARDPDQHAPFLGDVDVQFDVVFVGNLDAERVRWLEAAASYVKLAIFGEHTRAAVPRRSPLAGASFMPAVYGTALCGALARGAVSLNVMRQQNRFSHNMRSFESLACGAFTLSQRTPELAKMFRENEEVAFVDTPNELPKHLDYWLAHVAERRRIASGGFRRVENDTYDVRAQTVLQVASTHTLVSDASSGPRAAPPGRGLK